MKNNYFKTNIYNYTTTTLVVIAMVNWVQPNLSYATAIPHHHRSTGEFVNFNQIARQCGKGVDFNVLQGIARVESEFNPFAIGVVNGKVRQPKSLAEAVATAKTLHAQGKNFSMGLMQVNLYNLPAYGLDFESVFNSCKNISAGASILKSCFNRAGGQSNHITWQKAFSCYYSGNFRTGFRADFVGQPPYVEKVMIALSSNSPIQKVKYVRPKQNDYTLTSTHTIQKHQNSGIHINVGNKDPIKLPKKKMNIGEKDRIIIKYHNNTNHIVYQPIEIVAYDVK